MRKDENGMTRTAEGGTRTLTPLRTIDFESIASAIPPLRLCLQHTVAESAGQGTATRQLRLDRSAERTKLVCMTSPRPKLVQRLVVFLRSGAVGMLATVCDLGSLALMVRVLGWSPEASNIPSLFLGMVVM